MENNEQNNNIAKRGAGLIIIVVALLMAVLGLGGYIMYDKFFNDNKSSKTTEKEEKKEEKKEDKVENLEVTSNEVTDLFTSITTGWNRYCGINNYFIDKKVTTTDIDNDIVTAITLSYLYKSGVKFDEGSTFTKKQVEDTITKLFGKNYKYTYKTISGCPTFTYDESKEVYTAGSSGCGGTCGAVVLKKVVKATKTDSKIELYVRALFPSELPDENGYIKYYKFKSDEELQLERDNYNQVKETDANYNKGSLYKMTFTKEDNNYVFTSSEPVNE